MFRSIIHQFKQFTNYILLIVAPPDLLYQEKLLKQERLTNYDIINPEDIV